MQAQFSQMRPPAMVAPVNPRMPMYPPGAPGLGQQLFYGQGPPALIPPQVIIHSLTHYIRKVAPFFGLACFLSEVLYNFCFPSFILNSSGYCKRIHGFLFFSPSSDARAFILFLDVGGTFHSLPNIPLNHKLYNHYKSQGVVFQ